MTVTATGTETRDDADLEKVTELEAFGPERLDGVNGPANGFAPLMLKSIAIPPADQVPAATDQEGHIATVTEPAGQDTAAQAEVSPPASVEKATSEDTVTVEIPRGASISISPTDLAKLNTLKRQLVLEQSGEGQAAKRDMDPDVGGGVDRDKLKDSDFVFPDTRDFPVVTPADVSDAVSSWGRYKGGESFAAFKSRLTALAKRKGPKFVAELPDAWTNDDAKKDPQAGEAETAQAAKAGKRKGGKGNKPFPGAAPKFDGKDSDGDGVDADEPGSKMDDEKNPPEKVKPGSAKKDGAKDCPGCGKTYHADSKQRTCEDCGHDLPRADTAKAKAYPADEKVGSAIDRLEADAAAALAAQSNDPDAETHPADARVTEALERVKDDVEAAAAAQDKDEATDSAGQHAAKSASADAVYHLRRLHDATCAAYHPEDVIAVHPLAAKGLGALADPAPFAAMVSAAITEDAGTGSRAADLPSLSHAYHAAVAMKAAAAHDGLLDDAMDALRKAFADYYPDVHVKPGGITPGQFHRPYVSAGRANQAAKPGQAPRVPLSSHVPSPDDFNRPLITAAREAASPGSKPSGLGKARMYYSNAGKQGAATVLAAMHDWIADNHPTICPMTGVPYDNEPGVDVNSMGSSLTTAQPVPARMTQAGAGNSPVPVGAAHAASLVTPGPARKDKAAKTAVKEERKMAKAAQLAKEAVAAALAAQTPVLDPEVLKSALREVVAEEFGDVSKTIGDLDQRITDLESSPDPDQMAPRFGAAALGKTRAHAQEVPAGGDGPDTQRLMRLMKKTLDPDSGVRVAAIGELTELVGREKAAELLAAAN